MKSAHPLMELWTPDSWIEKMEELRHKPYDELTVLDKYIMSGIVMWMMGAPFIVGGAYYVCIEHLKSKAAKRIGMHK